MPLLCAKCEGELNSYETPFATKVFHPLQADDGLTIGYQEWMIKFCVSVSWRVLTHMRNERVMANDLTAAQLAAVDRALDAWSKVLRGESPHPGVHEQHFLPLGPIESHNVPDMPTNINRYLLRAIDMDFAAGRETLLIYSKLGPFALFGFIHPPEEKWEGSKVHVRHGVIKPRQYRLPYSMLDYLKDRARKVAALYDAISDAQVAKIDETAERHIDSLIGSKQAEAIKHDARLFGEEAVLRKRRTSP